MLRNKVKYFDNQKNLIDYNNGQQMKSRSPSKGNPCYIGQDKLKIIIRIRPILNQQDYEQFVQLEDDNTLQIKRPGICTYMKFNNILPPASTQKDVFHLVEDSIKEFLNGINMTIFAYGQTGAGKTYSMIGNYSPKDSQQNLFNFLSSKQRGILSRSLQMIMTYLHKKKGNKIFVSFFQIYNEKIFDLYNNNMVSLDIRQSKNGQISIPDLLNIEVSNMEEAIQFLMVGLKNRATGSTHGNAQSSRSHSIFQINLQKQNENGEISYSSLRIVDLAGSEKFKIPSDLSSAEKQIRIQQLTSINGSLSCLGHCISALIQKSRTHIPFRNSKLTRILSDSLLGQGKMRFIICISPSLSASAETFSTLQFANRAKKAIFQRSDMRTPNLSKKKSSENEQIASLKRDLEKQRQLRLHIEAQLNALLTQRPQGLMKQNAYLRKQNEKLKQQLKQLMVKKQNQKGMIAESSHRWQDLSPSSYNKENTTGQDLKEEMLRLPIFQNKKSLDIIESKLDSSKNEIKSSRAEGLKYKEIKESNAIPYNKKKAEFQKKIRKFIEADSPSQQVHTPSVKQSIKSNLEQRNSLRPQPYSYKEANNMSRASPSFNNKDGCDRSRNNGHSSSLWGEKQNIGEDHYQSSQIFCQNQHVQFQDRHRPPKSQAQSQLYALMNQGAQQQNGNEGQQQWIQNQDTQQLIEQACEKMNLPDFKDLKSEMDRAKHELMLLKQKDDEISRRKVTQIKY